MVDQWRRSGWPGVTSTTRALLEYWTHDERIPRLYWAQIEALETLIWMYEIKHNDQAVAQIIESITSSNQEHNDSLPRIASKMATGTGKTVVMAMIIVWHTCNSQTNPQKFAKQFVVITPGIIIRDRLQELLPSSLNNIYDNMNLIPFTATSQIKSAKIKIANYQSFKPRDIYALMGAGSREKKLLGVWKSKTSRESNSTMLRRILSGLDDNLPLVIINDEAHHCYKPGEGRLRSETKEDREKAALWFNALKIISSNFSYLTAIYDLSATPKFIERGERRLDSLFPWTVSDFPITDAIESGMVKVPRVPVGKTRLKPTVCRDIYDNTDKHFRKKLDSSKMPDSITAPLDSLYASYVEQFENYKTLGHTIPPVFIIIADSINNAQAFYEYVAGHYVKKTHNGTITETWVEGHCPLFSNHSNKSSRLNTILVHSRLDEDTTFDEMKEIFNFEAQRFSSNATQTSSEIMRNVLSTVGKQGTLGEQIRCVISVSMLTEGWDAKNVTHVFGFRRFGTQLLCEQASGRALRRSDTTSIDWYKFPEFAEIFGIPFSYMVDMIGPPPPPVDKTYVYPKDNYDEYSIQFPIVERYVYHVSPTADVVLDTDKIREYVIRVPDTDPTKELLEGVVGPTQNILSPSTIHLQAAQFRLAKIAVENWLGINTYDNNDSNMYNYLGLFAQMRRNVYMWMNHSNITKEHGFEPYWLLLKPHNTKIPYEVIRACTVKNNGRNVKHEAIFSTYSPATTSDIRFETSVPHERICLSTNKCQHNCAPCDSLYEVSVANVLDQLEIVLAWTRNHSIKFGWSIPYYFNGHWTRYYPDFIARLVPTHDDINGLYAVIEVKGVPDELSKIKEKYARDIWAPAVTSAGLGRWEYVYITDLSNVSTQINQARERRSSG